MKCRWRRYEKGTGVCGVGEFVDWIGHDEGSIRMGDASGGAKWLAILGGFVVWLLFGVGGWRRDRVV